jgi:hypothetical protein
MTRSSNIAGLRAGSGASAIGVRLKGMFDSVASGPMPDHLLALVDQLEAAYRADRPADGQAVAAAEAT